MGVRPHPLWPTAGAAARRRSATCPYTPAGGARAQPRAVAAAEKQRARGGARSWPTQHTQPAPRAGRGERGHTHGGRQQAQRRGAAALRARTPRLGARGRSHAQWLPLKSKGRAGELEAGPRSTPSPRPEQGGASAATHTVADSRHSGAAPQRYMPVHPGWGRAGAATRSGFR